MTPRRASLIVLEGDGSPRENTKRALEPPETGRSVCRGPPRAGRSRVTPPRASLISLKGDGSPRENTRGHSDPLTRAVGRLYGHTPTSFDLVRRAARRTLGWQAIRSCEASFSPLRGQALGAVTYVFARRTSFAYARRGEVFTKSLCTGPFSRHSRWRGSALSWVRGPHIAASPTSATREARLIFP